jgi:hypothetical protein
MEKIEIRPNRKYLIPFTGILIFGFFFMNYVTFFTDYYEGRHFIWKVLSIVLSVCLVVSIYKLYKLIKANAPFIIMTRNKFTYHEEGIPISHNWNDISSWDISNEDSATYLTIEVFGNKEKIGIDWLDKNPKQIDELIRQFK